MKKTKQKHVTTISGPQADAIIREVMNGEKLFTFVNKSVPGCSIVELWSE